MFNLWWFYFFVNLQLNADINRCLRILFSTNICWFLLITIALLFVVEVVIAFFDKAVEEIFDGVVPFWL